MTQFVGGLLPLVALIGWRQINDPRVEQGASVAVSPELRDGRSGEGE
jgi:hypothetical protein